MRGPGLDGGGGSGCTTGVTAPPQPSPTPHRPTTGAPTNWARNVTFRAARVHQPTSLDALCTAVSAAEKVRVLGTGHSFNRIADTEGDLLRLDRLPPRIEIDASAGTVTASAGLRYAEVAAALHRAGLALGNLASLPHISLAGACATGTHGSGDAQAGLGAAVVGLRLVGPDGEVTALERTTTPERIPGAVVALGALGVVTELTLAVEPAFEVAQWVYRGLPLGQLRSDFDAVFAAAHSVSAFTDWSSGTAMVWLKRRVDRDGAGHLGDRWLGATLADRPHHPVPGMPPRYCTEQGGVPGPWHERLPHFRPDFTPSRGEELQSELLLPRTATADALTALCELGDRIAPALQVSEVRTVAADDLWLSPSYGRDTVAFHFTWVPDAAVALPAVAAVEERLLPMGARPHWGKLTAADPATLLSRYPRAEDFRRLLRDHDPAGKFRNPHLEDLLATR